MPVPDRRQQTPEDPLTYDVVVSDGAVRFSPRAGWIAVRVARMIWTDAVLAAAFVIGTCALMWMGFWVKDLDGKAKSNEELTQKQLATTCFFFESQDLSLPPYCDDRGVAPFLNRLRADAAARP